MVIFEVWPAARGMLPPPVGRELQRIADDAQLSDHMLIDLRSAVHAQPDAGFIAVWATNIDDHASPDDSARLLGFGQVSTGNAVDLVEIGIADDPVGSIPDFVARLSVELFDTTVDAQQALHPERDVVVWTTTTAASGQAIIERAHERGFSTQRTLLRMERPLPAEPAEVTTRGFDVEQDLPAFLAVNNAAFTGHPEQGGWTVATFETRANEPWFERDGLRIVEVDGRVAGFCWVKLHERDQQPPLGEIYVVAVHPDFAGKGLGTQLVLAGMEWMVTHDATEAMLFVQADNAPAVTVYERLGYTVASERVALAPTPPLSTELANETSTP